MRVSEKQYKAMPADLQALFRKCPNPGSDEVVGLFPHMSFVGPRPALFNQADLIQLRTASGVSDLVPGLTGWAQINGRDELPILEKVRLDAEYLRRRSLWFDLKILWRTAFKVASQDGVVH